MNTLPSSNGNDQSSNAMSRNILWFALLLTALVYAGTLTFGFVYDDQPQIVTNTTFSSWKLIPSLFFGHSWKFLLPDWTGNYYRPIFMTWLLANRMIFGLHPMPWHATTVLLHLLATALTFVVARQILRDGTQAAFVALLFGLHPIHIESVAWVSGVTDPLMAVFTLGAFAAWVKGQYEPERRLFWHLLAVVLYAAGCLSKETALFLPIAIVAYDFLFARDERNKKSFLSSVFHAWPLWIVAAAYLAARLAILRGLVHSSGLSVSSNILTVPTIMWGYMRRLVWPVHMAVFYDTPPVTSVLQWRFWLPTLAWIIAGVLAWRIAKRSRVVAFSLIWIFTFLSPAIVGLPSFPLGEWIHDRYLYLPSFGFCLLLVHAIAHLPSERKFSGIPAIPALTVLVLTAAMALGLSWQEQYWANGYMLFRHSNALQPNSPLNKVHLATELLRRGDMANAQRLYQDALVLDPNDWSNHLAYGLFLYATNNFESAEDQFAQCIRISEVNPSQYFYQGMSRLNLGNLAGAQQSFEMALEKGPNRVGYHFWLGFAFEKQGRLDDARHQYEQELQQHPDTAGEAAMRLKSLPLH